MVSFQKVTTLFIFKKIQYGLHYPKSISFKLYNLSLWIKMQMSKYTLSSRCRDHQEPPWPDVGIGRPVLSPLLSRAKTRSIHPIQETEKGMRAPDPLLHPSMWNFLHFQPTYKNSKLGDPNQDIEKATCPISFKMKECLWIGFNSTSLLVWSGFDVPFGRHLTRRLYVAEFNFRVPHPCRFGMETFHCKV